MQNDYTALEDLVRTQYANVFWSHKIQEKQAQDTMNLGDFGLNAMDEDIVDTGNTVVELKKILAEHGASESYICTMLLKPEAYKQDIAIDYVAMEIPNDFIVGFGLDYDELGRNYKDIYVLDI